MDKVKSLDLIFTKWSSSLKMRDRSSKSYRPNFEELFLEWKNLEEASFEELYETWLPKAIKAHLPVSAVIRATYKRLKSSVNMDKTEKEFSEEWIKSIEDVATAIFFEFFPPPKSDDDGEPKIYGNMSAKEYSTQRRYADQFLTIDTSQLKKMWKDQQYNTNVDDLMGKDVLGDIDETDGRGN